MAGKPTGIHLTKNTTTTAVDMGVGWEAVGDDRPEPLRHAPPFWSVVDSPPAMTADFIAEPSGSDNHRYTGPAAERPLFTVIVPLLNEERWKLKRVKKGTQLFSHACRARCIIALNVVFTT